LRRQEGRFGGTLPDQLIPALRTTVLVGLQRCQREAESVEPVIVGTVAISGDELSVDSTILADSDPVETPADRSVRITIRRLQTPGKLMHGFCVTLDAQRPEEDRQARSSGVTPSVDDPIAAHLDTRARSVLEEELKYTKDSLHSTIEELETSNEELQATNEEMIASNEELQSTNEELHSVNEELYTVNSEHQRKIEELVELTDDMENLFLSSQDATIFLDSSGILRRITPRACEIFKLSELDAGRPLNHFRNPLKYKTLYEDIDALDPDGGPIESEVLDHDGNRYLLRLSPYRSSRGNSGTVLTLTSLQQLESARGQLEQREAMFRGTFENAAVGFAHVAMDGSWLRVNDRLCQLLGYTRDELLSLTFQSITHLDDLDSDLEQLERLKNGEIDSYSMEKRYVQKSGDALTTDLTVSLENDLNKGEPYFISIIQDATQRSNYQRELRAAISQRDQFLAVMSHELRNPLGALRNAVEYLKRTPAGGDRATEFLKVVDRQAVHVTRLVDDLLDTSRLTQNRITLQQELLNFCEVAGECIDAMRAVIESKPLGLSFSVNEPSLPIIGDRTRLLQIVENLLTNAKRYTPEGGSVQVSLKAAEGFAELTIADDGIGIAEENLDDIFNMFIRASDTRETQGGLGIGLALVKMLVDQHSGTISARSEGVGQGSAFTLRLPLVEYPQMEERNLPEERAKTKSVFQIVLVEDDEDARMTMHALLGLDGHEVSLAKDGVEGLELITATRPDFALVDLSMPLMNGTQVAKAVRADSSMDTVKLIALTGHGQPHDIKRTQEAGFDGHLTKPIDMNELAKTMNELSS
jgi:two-component system CheB/CheR fusion protein